MAGWFDQHRYPGGSSTFNEKAGAYEAGGIVGDPRLHDGIPGNAGTGNIMETGGGSGIGVSPGLRPGGTQDPRAFLQSLARGGKLTPEQLKAAEPQLQQMGIRLLGANSEGIQSKIMLPSGQSVDLIRDAGGDNGFQWLAGRGAAGGGAGGGGMTGLDKSGLPPGYWTGQETGGGQYPLAAAGGPGLATPWTTPFKSPGDFQSPGDFKAPNVTDDPGFKFRMEEAQKGLERSAASRGTLLTGGTLIDLAKQNQGLASQEYANAYGRALGENNLAYGRAWDENNLAYGRGLGEYNLARGIYGENNANLFNRLSGIAGLGQQADTSGFANSMGNLITGAGNAQAAGTVGSANAWGGALGNIGNSAPFWYQMAQDWRNRPGGSGGYGMAGAPPMGGGGGYG